jgi:hypothetical protein
VNKGFSWATGQVALIQSSDDLSAPGAFAAAMERFQSDPSLGLVYGNYDLIDATGHLIEHIRVGRYSLRRLLSRRTFVPQPCAFFNLALARSLGGWDERFPYTPDTELWFKIALNSRVVVTDETFGLLREHDERRDRQGTRIVDSYLRMIRESRYIADAGLAQRYAAAVGAIQIRLRYGEKTPSAQFYWAWRLFLADPSYFFEAKFPKYRLVPFYFRLAAVVGRARRFMRNLFRDSAKNGSAG